MNRPVVVCLCGSTRFTKEYAYWQNKLTIDGEIVLTVGCTTHSDDELFQSMNPKGRRLLKARLDVLHLFKIQMCDYVLILNPEGYIGESTEREIEYAKVPGKEVRYLE